MTQFLPPNLLALFAPRDPIPFVPPLDQLPWEKKHTSIVGVADFLHEFEDPKDTPPPTRVETKEERKERKRKERAEQVAYKLEQDLALWDPNTDPNSTADPFKTLFVTRINYDSSESKLKREFESYGPVKMINLVHDTKTQKPRGFAFVEFEHERDMHSAYKHADGKKIDGRRVLVDIERGRTIKGWRPRRLGGGLGGTRKGGPDVNTKYSGRDDNFSRQDRSQSRERGDMGGRDRDRDRDRGARRRRSRSRDEPDRDQGGRMGRDRDRGERRRRSRSPRDSRDRGDRGERGPRGRPDDEERPDKSEERTDMDRPPRERPDRSDRPPRRSRRSRSPREKSRRSRSPRDRKRKRTRSRERKPRSRSRERAMDREKDRQRDRQEAQSEGLEMPDDLYNAQLQIKQEKQDMGYDAYATEDTKPIIDGAGGDAANNGGPPLLPPPPPAAMDTNNGFPMPPPPVPASAGSTNDEYGNEYASYEDL